MLALSSPSMEFPSNIIGRPLGNSEQNHIYKVDEASDDPQMELHSKSKPSIIVDDDPLMVKKLNHNACERERRKKINLLFSSLRSLLPHANQKKKLSNPTTVSAAVKYIPNLQKQVEELTEKKKELLSSISRRQGDVISQEKQVRKRDVASWSPLSAVSANRLNDREVAVQISTCNVQIHMIPLSYILLSLEEDGLHPLNISSSESFGGRVFYHLHLQVENQIRMVECRILKEKIMGLFENIDDLQAFSMNIFGCSIQNNY